MEMKLCLVWRKVWRY